MRRGLKTFIGLSIIIALSGCYAKMEDSRQANVLFHTAYFNDWLQFTLNNTVVTNFLPTGNSTPYTATLHGDTRILVKDRFSNDRVDTLVRTEPFQSYTYIGYNPASRPRGAFVRDNLTPPPPGKAHVRIFYCAEIGRLYPINVTIRSSLDNIQSNNRVFNDQLPNQNFQSFVPIAAPGVYNLEVRSGTTLLLNEPTLNFREGKIYTVIILGPEDTTIPLSSVNLSYSTITHN